MILLVVALVICLGAPLLLVARDQKEQRALRAALAALEREEAEPGESRLLLVSEAVLALDHYRVFVRQVPRAVARLSLLTGAGAALFRLAGGLGGAEGVSVDVFLLLFVGAAGAVQAALRGRSALGRLREAEQSFRSRSGSGRAARHG